MLTSLQSSNTNRRNSHSEDATSSLSLAPHEETEKAFSLAELPDDCIGLAYTFLDTADQVNCSILDRRVYYAVKHHSEIENARLELGFQARRSGNYRLAPLLHSLYSSIPFRSSLLHQRDVAVYSSKFVLFEEYMGERDEIFLPPEDQSNVGRLVMGCLCLSNSDTQDAYLDTTERRDRLVNHIFYAIGNAHNSDDLKLSCYWVLLSLLCVPENTTKLKCLEILLRDTTPQLIIDALKSQYSQESSLSVRKSIRDLLLRIIRNVDNGFNYDLRLAALKLFLDCVAGIKFIPEISYGQMNEPIILVKIGEMLTAARTNPHLHEAFKQVVIQLREGVFNGTIRDLATRQLCIFYSENLSPEYRDQTIDFYLQTLKDPTQADDLRVFIAELLVNMGQGHHFILISNLPDQCYKLATEKEINNFVENLNEPKLLGSDKSVAVHFKLIYLLTSHQAIPHAVRNFAIQRLFEFTCNMRGIYLTVSHRIQLLKFIEIIACSPSLHFRDRLHICEELNKMRSPAYHRLINSEAERIFNKVHPLLINDEQLFNLISTELSKYLGFKHQRMILDLSPLDQQLFDSPSNPLLPVNLRLRILQFFETEIFLLRINFVDVNFICNKMLNMSSNQALDQATRDEATRILTRTNNFIAIGNILANLVNNIENSDLRDQFLDQLHSTLNASNLSPLDEKFLIISLFWLESPALNNGHFLIFMQIFESLLNSSSLSASGITLFHEKLEMLSNSQRREEITIKYKELIKKHKIRFSIASRFASMEKRLASHPSSISRHSASMVKFTFHILVNIQNLLARLTSLIIRAIPYLLLASIAAVILYNIEYILKNLLYLIAFPSSS